MASVSGWSLEHNPRDLSLVPPIYFSFVETYTKSISKASGKSHMDKGYKYFSQAYLHNITVEKVKGLEYTTIRAKCHKSMKKNEQPHGLMVKLSATCSCAKGIGQACGHVTGLRYQLVNFKLLKLSAVPEDVAKTSQPMTWHQPRGPKLKGTEIQRVSVAGYNSSSLSHTTDEQMNVSSTLFNPVRGEFPKMEELRGSPDRRIYDPQRNPPFGLLEIKCPQVSSVLEATCLSLENGISTLKCRHMYYTQIQAQLAITGLDWCDLFIWCDNDHHKEEIKFDQYFWQDVKDKLDILCFEYFL